MIGATFQRIKVSESWTRAKQLYFIKAFPARKIQRFLSRIKRVASGNVYNDIELTALYVDATLRASSLL